MIIRPPRREPRVLALSLSRHTLLWTVTDPFEIRSAGSTFVRKRTLADTARRLVKREKPTVIVVTTEELADAISLVAEELGLAIVTGKYPRLPVVVATDLYPELPLHCPTPRLARLATFALSMILHAPDHPRQYAKTLRTRTPVRAA